jgi:hypothetical protein
MLYRGMTCHGPFLRFPQIEPTLLKSIRSYFFKTTKLWVDRLIGTADPIAGGGMSARLKISSVRRCCPMSA